jgi:hypothetical protein
MNERQAIAKLKKKIGPKIGWRYNKGALDAEGREQERQRLIAMRAEEEALKEALDAMRAKLLADPEYVQLRERWHNAKEAADMARSRSYVHPITVGRMGDMFFTVVADGDTWDDVVQKVLHQ